MFKRLTILLLLLASFGFAQTLGFPTVPTGFNCYYVGPTVSSGTTTYYWIQKVTPFGRSPISSSISVSLPASLGPAAISFVNCKWNQDTLSDKYDILKTTTSTTPTGACNCAIDVNETANTFTDSGQASLTYTVTAILPPPIMGGRQTATDTATLTVAQITGGAIGKSVAVLTGTPTAAAAYTLPLVTAVTAAFNSTNNPCYVGMTWLLSIRNTSAGANTITTTTNTGWTLAGTMTVAQNTVSTYEAEITSCASSTATLTSLAVGATL